MFDILEIVYFCEFHDEYVIDDMAHHWCFENGFVSRWERV